MLNKGLVFLLLLLIGSRAAAESCVAIAGLEPLRGAQTILIGEMHGTNEMPAFTSNLACHLLTQKQAVTVALELPHSWTAAMQQTSDLRMALKQAGWNSYWQDGRTSAAMLQLIETVTALRATGADISLLAFDVDEPPADGKRDHAMAARLQQAIQQQPERVYVVLTGNLHARNKHDSHPFAKEPMALLLAHALPIRRQLSLLGHYNNGTAWACFADAGCGAQPLTGKTQSTLHGIAGWRDPELTAIGYDAAFYLGTISASAPAVLDDVKSDKHAP